MLRKEALLPPSGLKFRSTTLLSGLNGINRESVSGASHSYEAKDDVPSLSKSLRWILNQSCSIHIFLVFLERFNWSLSMPAATAICVVPLTSSRGPPASKRSRFPKLAFQSSRSQGAKRESIPRSQELERVKT